MFNCIPDIHPGFITNVSLSRAPRQVGTFYDQSEHIYKLVCWPLETARAFWDASSCPLAWWAGVSRKGQQCPALNWAELLKAAIVGWETAVTTANWLSASKDSFLGNGRATRPLHLHSWACLARPGSLFSIELAIRCRFDQLKLHCRKPLLGCKY